MEDTNRRLSEYEKKKPRGLRNNNPGNIRHSPVRWKGEVIGNDPDFKSFESLAYGYRAVIRLLKTYYYKYKLTTIRGIINRYAPPVENDTDSYIRVVTDQTGYLADEELPFDKEHICNVVAAISRVENGLVADIIKIEDGWELL